MLEGIEALERLHFLAWFDKLTMTIVTLSLLKGLNHIFDMNGKVHRPLVDRQMLIARHQSADPEISVSRINGGYFRDAALMRRHSATLTLGS